MVILSDIINRIKSISLKWKLLIPFLFFAFSGTTTLTFIGWTSQQNLIRQEEKREILYHYRHFLERMNQREILSASLATMIAVNREVQVNLAQRDRKVLSSLLTTTYIKLKQKYNISQFHFHIPPGISFLRLHKPDTFGDDLSYRKTILDVMESHQPASGLEKGVTGFGIRGVAPIFHKGILEGTIGIGHSFGKAFLEDFYRSWNIDIALYEILDNKEYRLIATAGNLQESAIEKIGRDVIEDKSLKIMIAPENFPDQSILFGPIKDYTGNVVALIRLSIDRTGIQKKLLETRNLMLTVGLIGIFISFLLTYLVIILFTKPLKEIVGEAQDIAIGKRESHLVSRPMDEIGALTMALNTMLGALKKRRLEIETYAKTLEKRVDERTAELVASEDKYRNLVENVPLIVYRILRDGRTEFVNSYIKESLGYSIEEAVRDKMFWRDKISADDPDSFHTINRQCFKEGEDCRIESKVRAKDGRILDFITHAIPYKDSSGSIRWVDGIMMDITELKRLQEKALRSEEIKTLGEISARMAHEIRNPLSTAGGFARRLLESVKDEEHNRKMAEIIVEEVSKLEIFLQIVLSSIQPFDLVISDVDVNSLIKTLTGELRELAEARGVKIIEDLEPDLPRIQADQDRISQAFESILKHAVISTTEKEPLNILTKSKKERIVLRITHSVTKLTDDDLDKFFFPHTEEIREWSVQDLPLSKIIIHRHGGVVNLFREEGNILKMEIEFPVIIEEEEPASDATMGGVK